MDKQTQVAALDTILFARGLVRLCANLAEKREVGAREVAHALDAAVVRNRREVQRGERRAVPLEVWEEDEPLVARRTVEDALGLLFAIEDGVDPRSALGGERGDERLDHLGVDFGRLAHELARLGSVLCDVDVGAWPDELEREVRERVLAAGNERVRGKVLCGMSVCLISGGTHGSVVEKHVERLEAALDYVRRRRGVQCRALDVNDGRLAVECAEEECRARRSAYVVSGVRSTRDACIVLYMDAAGIRPDAHALSDRTRSNSNVLSVARSQGLRSSDMVDGVDEELRVGEMSSGKVEASGNLSMRLQNHSSCRHLVSPMRHHGALKPAHTLRARCARCAPCSLV